MACGALSFALCFAAAGCVTTNGRDGVDGKDLNIYDIYAAVKAETANDDLTFDEFLREYLSYTPSDIEEAVSIQKSVNKSLLSGVAVRSSFIERVSGVTVRNTYSGSGIILDIDRQKGDMTVVTNCHVVYSAKANFGEQDGYCDDVSVWLYGSEFLDTTAISAKVVAASKTYDTAILKIEGSEQVKRSKFGEAAKWRSDEETYLGETVYAIGNANGEKLSANLGYISKDLDLVYVNLGTDSVPEQYYYNVLRTSATINSGNSGGGLYNIGGEVVGLVNAKGRAESVGVGYALPASAIKRVAASMIERYAQTGEEAHGVNVVKHGVETEITDSYSTGLNDKGFAEIVEEVTVKSVAFGKTLGTVERGDIIKRIRILRNDGGGERAVEDMPVKREHNFKDVMLAVRAGDTVEYTLLRDGKEIVRKVTYLEDDFQLI